MTVALDGLTIVDVADGYRTGELSPVEVVEGCLARIAERDGELQAFATVTTALARARARAAADELPGDPATRRPLLGIPVAVKDIIDVAGVPTGAGIARDSQPAAVSDATVWRRLAQAGAVLVGKTRTHPFAYGVSNPPTRNPHDPSRMSGGSSGGSAVAVAAGMCLAAVGTDTLGSVRIPAALCGVVGLKPTTGHCARDGVRPLSPTLDHIGPLSRTPGDAATVLAAMSGQPCPRSAVDIGQLRVGLAATDALWSPDVRATFAAAVSAFEAAGATVVTVPGPSFTQARWHGDRIITVEAGVVHADELASRADALPAEIVEKLAAATRVDGPTYYRALRHAEDARRRFDDALSDVDVLLAPGVAVAAPPYGADAVRLDGRDRALGHALCGNMAAANLAGVPAVVVPTGTDGDGLPLSVQLVGRAGTDASLLDVAAAAVSLST